MSKQENKEQAHKPRLREKYERDVVPALMAEFGYKNKMQVPKIQKVVVNASMSDAVSDPKILQKFQEDLTLITGQKAVLTRAKKAISNFKLRAGIPIGARVTLRRAHMYEFLDRLMNVALPRVRDFKGVSAKAFDGRGNYSLGIIEHVIFPEIDPNKVEKSRGFNVAIVTSATTDKEAKALLDHIGMPFRK